MNLQVQFIGATGTVTGSKYLLRVDGKNILIDCGLFQGLKVLRLRNWNALPIAPDQIDAVILTHAHLDHSGYIPLLVKNGFKGKIYCTEGTEALCRILLPDSGYLQEEDAAFLNRHGLSKHKVALPLYTEKDAIASLDYLEPIPWGKSVFPTPDSFFEFHPAGHIVGAAMIRLTSQGTSITFSGDLGRPNSTIMSPPAPLPESDYLVVESTYGNRKHAPEDPLEDLRTLLGRALKRRGVVLIPAFAVGRAQEILFLISKLKKQRAIPDVPVYLNSPMSIRATSVYCDFVGEHRLTEEDCRAINSMTRFVSTVEESKRLVSQRDPAIIISASGMATGGRVLHHLDSLAPDPKNLILFAGFQAVGTRGEAMIHGTSHIKIHGEQVPVGAEVAVLDSLSAHADSEEILSWLSECKRPPKMTFITHGEPLASEALRKKIKDTLHWSAKVPDYLETCQLE